MSPQLLLQKIYSYRILQHNCVHNFYCRRYTTTVYCSTTASTTSTAENIQLTYTAAQLRPRLPLQKIYNYRILQHNCIQNLYCRKHTTNVYCSTTASTTSTAEDIQLPYTAAQLRPRLLLQKIYNYRILQHNCVHDFY
jgi:hypothetical protein